jgi:hypothetical protein
MKPGYGSRKGSAFERKIAKDLSLWITDGKTDRCLWRTHASGSFGTNTQTHVEMGDIMSITDAGKILTEKFNIECRHGLCIKSKDLIYSPAKSSMLQFIKEGRENARVSNRSSLWIFREQGHTKIMVMLDWDEWGDHFAVTAIFPQHRLILLSYEQWKAQYKPFIGGLAAIETLP